jgi:hypothetical protein
VQIVGKNIRGAAGANEKPKIVMALLSKIVCSFVIAAECFQALLSQWYLGLDREVAE